MGCCVSISQSEVGILERWGVYQQELRPGLHFLVPVAEQVVGKISTRLKTFHLSVQTKTKENTFCTIHLSVHNKFRDDDIRNSFYSVNTDSLGDLLKSHVQNLVRAEVPTMTLEELFMSSSKLATSFRDKLNEALEAYGIDVVSVLIVSIDPDALVKQAMNAMNAAERDRVTAISTAEAAKITQVKKAEAEAESRHLAGVGVANARRAIAEGLADSMSQFARSNDGSVSQNDVMQLILTTQYYDMLRDVGTRAGSTVIYLPPNASEAQQMAAQEREAMASSVVKQTPPEIAHPPRTAAPSSPR